MALRSATAEQHRRLDARMGALDLSTAPGRAVFQEIHDVANGRVLAACGGEAAEASDYLVRATASAGAKAGGAAAPIHPDAVAYVMLGSQLGLAYLRKSVPAPLRTGVLAPEPDIPAWRRFLARMAETPPQGALRDRILTDSARVFEIFLTAADQTLSSHCPEPE